MYSIGSSVELRTKQRSYYYNRTDDYEYVTFRGKVLPLPRYIDYPAVALSTDDPSFPMRIVALHTVEGYEEKEEAGETRAYTVQSKDKTYIVTKVNGSLSCSCVGFQFHRRCRHSDLYKD
jgi:hypothetical protein